MAFKNGPKEFAPETAVGTGAAEPLVNEYEAAKATPSVDESTLDGGGSQNQPKGTKTVLYSGHVENVSGDSTGEDFEVRNADNDDEPLAGAAVASSDEDEVNAKAEDVRPEAPQVPKRARKAS